MPSELLVPHPCSYRESWVTSQGVGGSVATDVWCSAEVLELQRGPRKQPSRAGPCLLWPSPAAISPAAMLDEDEDERVDEAALRQLTEMGFPESRAVKALRLNQ